MPAKTQFDKLSEEAMRLAKRNTRRSRKKIREVQAEFGNLKQHLTDTITERLSTSQQ